jgi:Lon protease-like protein
MLTQDLLPLFPLPLVILPEEKIALHIFEERYKDLINFCLSQREIGIEQVFGISFTQESKMAEVGCAVLIDRVVKRYEDGQLDIEVRALKRYQNGRLYFDRSYAMAEVHYLEDTIKEEVERELLDVAVALYQRLLELFSQPARIEIFSGKKEISFLIGARSGLDPYDKQKLLELRSERERIDFLIAYFRKTIPQVQEQEEIRARILLNGHVQKIFSSPLPEKS